MTYEIKRTIIVVVSLSSSISSGSIYNFLDKLCDSIIEDPVNMAYWNSVTINEIYYLQGDHFIKLYTALPTPFSCFFCSLSPR